MIPAILTTAMLCGLELAGTPAIGGGSLWYSHPDDLAHPAPEDLLHCAYLKSSWEPGMLTILGAT